MYPNLKMELWLAGVRQNRLARELNVDETVLSKVINGYKQPSPQLRKALALYFSKSESWLFEKTGERAFIKSRKSNGVDESTAEDVSG